ARSRRPPFPTRRSSDLDNQGRLPYRSGPMYVLPLLQYGSGINMIKTFVDPYMGGNWEAMFCPGLQYDTYNPSVSFYAKEGGSGEDRKSTRLNSSHVKIS